MIKSIGLFLVFVLSFNSFSQMEMPEDIVEWDFSVVQNGCDATIVGKLKVDKHWHINALNLPEDNFGIPTTFKLHKSSNYKTVGKVIEPKPIEKHDEVSKENLRYHEGTFTLKQKIKITTDKDFELKLDFGYQPCDSVKCLFPFEEVFTVKVKGCKSEKAGDIDIDEVDDDLVVPIEGDIDPVIGEVDNDSSVNNTNSENEKKEEATAVESKKSKDDPTGRSLWWIFSMAFFGGLVALITPCVFPMIPLTVSYFTKTSKTKAAGVRNAMKYGISIIAIYVVLGTAVAAIFGADILNAISTSPIFNVSFFLLLIIFGISFMGAFEIRLPDSWANKADSKADKGGFLGIFFMALALAIVSFSCTGPIVGFVLVQSASDGAIAAPVVGMLGFGIALALPFTLFAAFPGWMNTMPKSGGWMNTVKVVLGIVEIAFAFKFLSMADMALQTHLLERELFISIWIGIFTVLAMYLFGFIRLPHDSKLEKLSVGRTLFGTFVLIFVIYLIPGMWGAPLKIINAFPPPMSYSEAPLGFGGGGIPVNKGEFIEGTHLGPQNIMVFHDYDMALAHAKEVKKPVMIDFTGWTCVNCRKMEESVWGEPGVIEILRDSVIISSLHVDDRKALPKDEQKEVTYPNGRKKMLKTYGEKWSFKEISEYKVASQPYYIMQDGNGEDLSNGSANYINDSDPIVFRKWLRDGLKDFHSAK
jgi:thiol:disulfide interchange protein DsbD